VEIGEEKETVVIEPVEDPVPPEEPEPVEVPVPDREAVPSWGWRDQDELTL
jgi:hypothetical protein